MEATERFQVALQRAEAALAAKKYLGKGIGTQSERMLHCVLKYYFEPDDRLHEVPIGRYIADIYRPEENRILEIQTRGFDRMREKLSTLLPEHKVTVIYPIAQIKWLSWVDMDTGEVIKSRKSPRKGKLYDILPEIYRLPEQQMHPNLSFLPVLMEVIEYKALNGWSRDKKRGACRLERIPKALEEGYLLEMPEDYSELLPATLPEEFTAKEFEKATGLKGSAPYGLKAIQRAGAVEQTGKKGRAYLYRKVMI